MQNQTMEVDTSGMEDMASGSLKMVMSMETEEMDTWLKTEKTEEKPKKKPKTRSKRK